jgi:hypothetical protein
MIDEEIPCILACGDDRLVAVPNQCAELIAAEIFPDILNRVQLRRVGRQMRQSDVVGRWYKWLWRKVKPDTESHEVRTEFHGT